LGRLLERLVYSPYYIQDDWIYRFTLQFIWDTYWYTLSRNGRIVFRSLVESRIGTSDVSKMSVEQVKDGLATIRQIYLYAAEQNKVREMQKPSRITDLQLQINLLNYIYELLDKCKLDDEKINVETFVTFIMGRSYIPPQINPKVRVKHLIECILNGDLSSEMKRSAARDMITVLELMLSMRDGKNFPTDCAWKSIVHIFDEEINDNIISITPTISRLAARKPL